MGTAKRERQKAGRQTRREEAAVAVKKQQSRKQLRTYLIFAGVIAALILFFVWRGSGDDSSTTATTGASGSTASGSVTTTTAAAITYGTTPCPATDGSAVRAAAYASPFAKCIDDTKTYTATIKTNKGDLVVDLDAKAAPVTVNNFVSLARSKFYDATPCHRIIPGFMAQCGDPKGTGTGGPGYQFTDELPTAGSYKIGSIAMANSGPNTNGSQFFIITGAQGVALPPSYSLFGQVRAGQDAVLAALDAAGNPANNGVPPKEAVGITAITVTES